MITNLILLTSVCFTWFANTETNLAGYNLYYGSGSGVYTNVVFVPAPRTNGCLSLLRGITNFFVLTAVLSNGLESLPTTELSHWTPAPSVCLTMEMSTNGGKTWEFVKSLEYVPEIMDVPQRIWRGVMTFP